MASILSGNMVWATVMPGPNTGNKRELLRDVSSNFQIAESDLAVPGNEIQIHEADGVTLAKYGIVEVHRAPAVANAIPDQAATQDVAFSFQFASNAFSGGGLVYTATLADDNPLPAWLAFDPATRTFSGTPLVGNVGTASIKVIATNRAGTINDTFDIVVAGA